MKADDWQAFLKQNQQAQEKLIGIEYEGNEDMEEETEDYGLGVLGLLHIMAFMTGRNVNLQASGK